MSEPLAIVGTAFRLPRGIDDRTALWRCLVEGEICTGPMPEPRRRLFPEVPEFPDRAGWLDEIDGFDAAFFGMKGIEACYTDPQQRLLLETAWSALEDAAIDPGSLSGRAVGTFIGAHTHDYLELAARAGTPVTAYWNQGMNGAVLANRISYFFDWTGPSITINTACSSSLEALVQAAAAIRDGRCEMALVGGVNLILSPTVTQSAARAGMLAPDGRIKAFDAGADGFVRGEGAVALVLAPLAKARARGLPIHGTLLAARSGHGGRSATFTAPNPKRQAALIAATWREAGVPPSMAGMIEAHGTGTRLGDSIEAEGLKAAFSALIEGWDPTSPPFCGLTSIKTNLGHLESAAGLAGVVKSLLAMRHGLRPALAGFQKTCELVSLAGSPFFPLARHEPWPEGPRSAGVSSIGFGGAHAHVVLGEAPVSEHSAGEVGQTLVPLSARDREGLIAMARRLRDHPEDALGALAHTLRVGRAQLPVRLGIVCSDREALDALLEAFIAAPEIEEPRIFHGGKPRRGGALPVRVCQPLPEPLDWLEIAKAWVAGTSFDFGEQGRAQRLSLPVYPFTHKRYWLPE